MGSYSSDISFGISTEAAIATRREPRIWFSAFLIAVASFALFVLGLSNAATTIFDEVAYINPSRALLVGAQNPNAETPPLGKLIIAGGIWLLGDNPVGWRVSSAVFGSAALAGVFIFLFLLLREYHLAIIGTLLTLLNNFLYIFARTAMVEIYLVAFATWALVAFTAALTIKRLTNWQRRALMASSGILLGFACASKWNGVDELGVVILISGALMYPSGNAEDPDIVRCRENIRSVGLGWLTISFVLCPVIAYAATFWPVCRSQGLPFSVRELFSMNAYIWHFHRLDRGNIGLNRPWYTWPFETQPTRALSYLVGNWFVMWAGLAALLHCAWRFARRLPETLIVLLYVVNMLQWAVTPQRLEYYYYYFAPAMFVGMAIPVALNRSRARCFGIRISILSVLAAFCVFAYCFAHMALLGAPYDTMLGYWP